MASKRAIIFRWFCFGPFIPLLLTGCAAEQDHAFDPHPRGVNHYVNGVMAYQNGQTEQAITELMASEHENSRIIMPHIVLGDIYRSQQDYRKALPQYQSACELDAYDYHNHYNLGVTYQFLNRLQEAAAAYLRALKLEPDDPKTNMNLGLVYLSLNQPVDAEKMLRRAVQLDPRSADAHCNLAVLLESLGKYTEAEKEYLRALELSPDHLTALYNVAGVMNQLGEGKPAIEVMQMLLKLHDTPEIRKRFGDALVVSGRDDDAYTQYNLALQSNPRYWQAMNQVGMIFIRRYEAGTTLDETWRQRALKVWKNSLTIESHQPQLQEMYDKYNANGRVLP